MLYKYHILRRWSTYEDELTEEMIKTYFKYDDYEEKYGLYEEWIVMTEKEFKEYCDHPPNYDKLIRVLDKYAMD